jgi:hypothetical protein
MAVAMVPLPVMRTSESALVSQDMVVHGGKFFVYARPGQRVLVNGQGDMLVRVEPPLLFHTPRSLAAMGRSISIRRKVLQAQRNSIIQTCCTAARCSSPSTHPRAQAEGRSGVIIPSSPEPEG